MKTRLALEFLDKTRLTFAQAGSQLRDHIYDRSREAFAGGDAARAALDSAESVRARQAALRSDFIDSIGGLPDSDTPLNAVITGVVRTDGFTIEKIVYESRPCNYVTANLYLPVGLSQPSAAVLLLMGHGTPGKQYESYQGVAQTLAAAGLIVLAQDPPGQGERFSYLNPDGGEPLVAPGTCEHEHAGFQCRLAGDSPARYFLHDAMRGIDYLISRPEVDAHRIGVTGNSGGGTQTSMVMMADPRIAAAAPGTFITTRGAYQPTGQPQDAEQHFYGLSAKGYDHADFLIAMAPRPVCVLAVTSDFFPIEGTRAAVSQARHAWALTGAPADTLQLVEDDALHSYTPVLAKAAARFFSRALLGREAQVEDFTARPYPAEVLNATPSGQVGLDYGNATFIFDENLRRLKALELQRHALPAAQRLERAKEWLRDQVHRGRVQTAPNPRKTVRGQTFGECTVDEAFWWSQPGLANMGALIRRSDTRGATAGAAQTSDGRSESRAIAATGVTIALLQHGTFAAGRHAEWIEKTCVEEGRAVLVLNLSGMGPLLPDPVNAFPLDAFFGTFHKFVDDLTWLGDSLVQLRTFELIRALDMLSLWPELDLGDIRLYAHGRVGMHGKLAALIDPRICSVQWEEPFTYAELAESHLYEHEGIKQLLLPGVLRYFDLDEI